jgi:hypothetical protein
MKLHKKLSLLLACSALLSQAAMADITYTPGETLYGVIPAGAPCSSSTPAVTINLSGQTTGLYLLDTVAADSLVFSTNDVGGIGNGTGMFQVPVVTAGSGTIMIRKGYQGVECETAAIPYAVRWTAVDSTTGTLVVRTAPDAMVQVFNQWGDKVDETTANSEGVATFDLTAGSYTYAISTDGGAVWSGQKPRETASKVKVIADKTVSKKQTVGTAPVITGLTQAGTTITITGSNFGAKIGALDFGGFVTSSKSAAPTWTNTEIKAKLPAKALAGCLRVFAKDGGWSPQCLPFDL